MEKGSKKNVKILNFWLMKSIESWVWIHVSENLVGWFGRLIWKFASRLWSQLKMQVAFYWLVLLNMPLGGSIHEKFLFLSVWGSMCGNRIRSYPFIDCFFVTVMTKGNLAWEGRACLSHLWGKLSRNREAGTTEECCLLACSSFPSS